jgi:hypothetical protein
MRKNSDGRERPENLDLVDQEFLPIKKRLMEKMHSLYEDTKFYAPSILSFLRGGGKYESNQHNLFNIRRILFSSAVKLSDLDAEMVFFSKQEKLSLVSLLRCAFFYFDTAIKHHHDRSNAPFFSFRLFSTTDFYTLNKQHVLLSLELLDLIFQFLNHSVYIDYCQLNEATVAEINAELVLMTVGEIKERVSTGADIDEALIKKIQEQTKPFIESGAYLLEFDAFQRWRYQ